MEDTHNRLTVSGNERELNKFKKIAKMGKHPLVFNNFLPVPKELLDIEFPGAENEKLIKKYGADNWYIWRKLNWGTAGHSDVELVENSNNEVKYHFGTEDKPPIKGIVSISKKFPNLKFEIEYFDEYCKFCGTAIIKNGTVSEDTEESIKADEYNVIYLKEGEPIIVKFLDRGHFLTMFRRNKNSNDCDCENLYRVEHNGEVKLLELRYNFAEIIRGVRVKGKTFVLISKMVEGRERIGMHEIPELNTFENFKKVFESYLFWEHADGSDVPF